MYRPNSRDAWKQKREHLLGPSVGFRAPINRAKILSGRLDYVNDDRSTPARTSLSRLCSAGVDVRVLDRSAYPGVSAVTLRASVEALCRALQRGVVAHNSWRTVRLNVFRHEMCGESAYRQRSGQNDGRSNLRRAGFLGGLACLRLCFRPGRGDSSSAHD